jgi:hypothetical protein|tara:strand:+ start:2896 stop:3120 length:225 start_codon:yes stop_codon:yes gene_type:complete
MAYGDRYQETPKEKERMRLIIALWQVNNIVELTKDNEFKTHLYSHLSSIKYELERQLTNLRISDNITKETQKRQ